MITQKNGGKEAKMQRDGSLEISGWETPNSPGNVFEESSKSVKILVNFMRNF